MKRHRVLPGTLLGVLLGIAAAGCAEKKSETAAVDQVPAASGEAATGQTPSASVGETPVPALKVPRRMRSDGTASEGETGEERRGRSRFRGAMRERFDENKDGQIDDTERAAMRLARAEQIIARSDTNGDGALSTAEIEEAQGPGSRFLSGLAAADTNGDGVLSAAEVEAGMAARQKERMERRRQRRAEREGQPAEAESGTTGQ